MKIRIGKFRAKRSIPFGFISEITKEGRTKPKGDQPGQVRCADTDVTANWPVLQQPLNFLHVKMFWVHTVSFMAGTISFITY